MRANKGEGPTYISHHVFMGWTHGFVAYPPQVQRWMFGIDTWGGCIKANRIIVGFLRGEGDCEDSCVHEYGESFSLLRVSTVRPQPVISCSIL